MILGSGPNAIRARNWDRENFDHILAINNAWQLRPDWDELIHPEDFPEQRQPRNKTNQQKLTTANDYVPAQNKLGGFVYAGGTMAFTAGYWALVNHRPAVIGFLGCDMVYPSESQTHFYGTGQADPLRSDITLQSLEAKSARLQILAAQRGCALVNLSQDDTRLVFPKSSPAQLRSEQPKRFDPIAVKAIYTKENQLGYFVKSGRYWEHEQQFDAAKLRELDDLWLEAHAQSI